MSVGVSNPISVMDFKSGAESPRVSNEFNAGRYKGQTSATTGTLPVPFTPPVHVNKMADGVSKEANTCHEHRQTQGAFPCPGPKRLTCCLTRRCIQGDAQASAHHHVGQPAMKEPQASVVSKRFAHVIHTKC